VAQQGHDDGDARGRWGLSRRWWLVILEATVPAPKAMEQLVVAVMEDDDSM